MKCQFCSKPATVHLSDLVNQKELHLCQNCAESQQMSQDKLNLPALLHSLLGQHLGPQTELARLVCPACGIRYMEFRAQGRLGCPHDYAVFRSGLAPLLQRIHRAERHVGKSPRRVPDPEGMANLIELRGRLQQAVDDEVYEEAARLRDLLRKKEATDESG